MLDVRGVGKRFGDVVALDGVSLQVADGGIVGFLGPNGAGKSTTMRAVMGLIAIDSGEITWNGGRITATTRRRFGYMPAERGMYPKMTVRDQLVYFARLAGLSASAAATAASTWMERVDIAHRADDEVQALSSGNQQRVQLAIALVHDPELLILDEPFSGLDPVAVETMKTILAEQMRRGTSVLFSSHQLDLVTDISRDVVIVDAGRVVMEGDVQTLRERSDVRYATVGFAEETTWDPTPSLAAEVIERSPRTTRVRVAAGTEPATLLADASDSGRVVEFSFTPPDLSEVFLAAIGRTAEALS
ncbi:MAG: putative sodium efflux transporter ATP-binding protein [Ilumatobacteraceae bacterium]|nr:putative sodium efflux transporter ATP-binding protein [Ilumatobacteraceae bacterium]